MGTVDPVSTSGVSSRLHDLGEGGYGLSLTKFTKDQRSVELNPIVKLATHMLSHLLIASMSLHLLVYFALGVHYGSQKSWREENPQESTYPSPNINRLRTSETYWTSSYQEESIGTEGTRV